MENRIGSPHEAEIPKKSRSLDLKSLYQSKDSKDAGTKNLKRKGSVDVSGVEKRHERKKSRKAVSISSFRKVNGNGSKSLEEVYNGSLSSGSHDSKDLKPGSNQRVNDSSGFSSISQTLDGSFIQIPRRKRGFVGRRKVENFSQVLKPAGLSTDKAGDVDKPSKIAGRDVKVKQKKGSDDFKENRNGETNSGRHFEEKDKLPDLPVVNSGDLSVKKSLNGHYVESNGDSSSKKSLRKRSRKRKDLASDDKSVAKEAEPSIDTSVKKSDDLQDDDEENLEENAARMLSSRFDPSCTVFSLNSKGSSLPSTNGLSFLLSSGQEFIAQGSNYVSGSESASVDTAGRVLRPRKQHKEKGNSRKRRHYYEIFSGDLDAYWVLNRRIKVFWPLDQSWYYGLISEYDKVKKLHHVKYDDRDEEWINLQNERFKLLLLPSEVPGKPQRKRSVTRVKRSNGEKGKLKLSKEKKKDSTTEDDNYVGNYMDSEPIISWLARTTHRVKSSPLRALKKQKMSSRSLTSVTSLLPDETVSRHDSSGAGSQNRDKINLPGNSAFADRFAAGGRIGLFPTESPINSKDRKLRNDNKVPVVYYRRRFRNVSSVLHNTCKDNHVSTSLPDADASLGPVIASGTLVKQAISLRRLNPDENLERLDTVEVLWLSDVSGLLKVNVQLVESRQLWFQLNLPLVSICDCLLGMDNTWFFHMLLLLQYGTLMTMWPRVHLEMLFVDNIVGLRFFLFEGCLKRAIGFVFHVLDVFHQPSEQGKYADLLLPVTSIKFKFSCIQGFRKQLVFAFYSFSEVKNSKWMHLDSRLKRHCLLTEQLPLSECTFDNIKALQNGTNQLVKSSVCGYPWRIKGPIRRSRQCTSLAGVSRDSTYVNANSSSAYFDKSDGWFPPFALSFSAAPTFFLGLHLKLLMEHSVTHISFQDHVSIEHPDNSDSLLDECSSVEDYSNKDSEITSCNNFKVSSRDANCDECLSCGKAEPQAIGISANSVGDWMTSSPNNFNNVANVGAAASSKDPGKFASDAIDVPQKQSSHHSGSEQQGLSVKPAADKCSTGSHSLLNGITVEIPPVNQFDKHVDKELHGAQQSTDLSWNMNGGIIPSPNPTARRSTWHRSRSSSTSFGYLAHGWSDGRGDFVHNNFGNGPKKPRTQVSYALPFGGFDYCPKNKSHSQKAVPHKRIRTASEKRSLDVSRGSERNLELSCEANVLITHGDRGWREGGAQVVVELFDHNEWKLAVKISGTTKYSYKAHQFLQPGSTNRYTHAMMWKGGKDWILEFPDRSQWLRFKEMHEECHNRNIRAALIKNIPIPGVRLIEENDDGGIEIPFLRSSSKYFRQVETDVEMALNPSRVLYDMDSDDDQWMLKNQTSSEVAASCLWEISEEMFEKTMDMLEKAAYSQQRDQFTSDEIEELMAGVGPLKVVKIIYEHWQQKRQRKGMPLIRHLQPPLWERYQQQVRECELAMAKCNTALPNGCHEKVATTEKPPMFAFCLKPRGLEVPNRGSKQRSQRKISMSVQNNNFPGDHDGFHAYGRRLNGFASGDEKFVYQGHNYEPLDDSPLSQISPRVFSPRDTGGKGYFSMSGDRYDRTHIHKLYRNKSKKPGAFLFPNDAQMVASYNRRMFDKRNGVNRWNMGFSEWRSQRHYHLDGPPSHGPEQFDSSDLDEFRLRDASGAARHALHVAKLKRERAQRLLYRADLAIHKAVVALMTAEAIKASSEDINSDG
ncbi:hypothetical protein JCGZ_13200 [Jatropha curcas]|uniref:Enhancer of polycomb-like protein n=1 Tax=Jatropha curcas TaxID=180498 RepID=A0A067KJ50_JATCU|nr:uncharacterized protein LOC105639237 [Jatropha curcas]KDP32275.1 hypothetical protein JCGZ_13200 [Jatropha curcas]